MKCKGPFFTTGLWLYLAISYIVQCKRSAKLFRRRSRLLTLLALLTLLLLLCRLFFLAGVRIDAAQGKYGSDTQESDEIPETVFEMAVNSIARNDDWVSESMAEVYARQGKAQKAIEIYEKLSLLNPEKNTYFAAKIENLQKDL